MANYTIEKKENGNRVISYKKFSARPSLITLLMIAVLGIIALIYLWLSNVSPTVFYLSAGLLVLLVVVGLTVTFRTRFRREDKVMREVMHDFAAEQYPDKTFVGIRIHRHIFKKGIDRLVDIVFTNGETFRYNVVNRRTFGDQRIQELEV